MRILVTGAAGRIGSRFVPRLLDQEAGSVRVLIRPSESAEGLRRMGAEIFHGDLLQPDTLTEALRGVDTVIHLAGLLSGAPDSETLDVNVRGTETLAMEAIRAGASHFIFSSTGMIYGPGRNRPFRESDPPNPPNKSYPLSKAAAERKLRELSDSKGLRLTILRLAFVYGEGDRHLADFMPALNQWNPARRMHMIHQADVSQAFLQAIRTTKLGARTYNIADDAPITAQELVVLHGFPELPSTNASIPFDPWEMIFDTRLARRELGFRPIFPSFYSAKELHAL